MSVLLLLEYSLEVASGKGFCKDLDKDYYRIGRSPGCWEAAKVCGVEKKPKVLHWSLFLFRQKRLQTGVESGRAKSSDPDVSLWSPSPRSPSPGCFLQNIGCLEEAARLRHLSDNFHTKLLFAF